MNLKKKKNLHNDNSWQNDVPNQIKGTCYLSKWTTDTGKASTFITTVRISLGYKNSALLLGSRKGMGEQQHLSEYVSWKLITSLKQYIRKSHYWSIKFNDTWDVIKSINHLHFLLSHKNPPVSRLQK